MGLKNAHQKSLSVLSYDKSRSVRSIPQMIKEDLCSIVLIGYAEVQDISD